MKIPDAWTVRLCGIALYQNRERVVVADVCPIHHGRDCIDTQPSPRRMWQAATRWMRRGRHD